MTDSIYFQWQNDVLRKTIYPLREMKLRDFLVFYQEIDLWKQYKGKTEDDPEIKAEIQTYKDAQVKRWLEALQSYSDFRAYFTGPVADSPAYREKVPVDAADPDELARINHLHQVFGTWFPKVRNPRSENYFISQRVYEWETHRKDLVHQISECQRKMRNYAPFPQYKPSYDQQAALLQKLQSSTLKMADAELQALYDFLTVCNRLEKRRTQVALEKANAQRQHDVLARQLAALTMRVTPLESQVGEVEVDLGRLKNPPDRAALEQYFLSPTVSPPLAAGAATELASKIRDVHNGLQMALRISRENYGKLLAVQNQAQSLRQYRRSVEQQIAVLESNLHNMPATWSQRPARQAEHDFRIASLKTIDLELAKLEDFEAVLSQAQQTPAQLVLLAQQKEKQHSAMQASLDQLKGQAKGLQDQIQTLDATLSKPEQAELATFSPTEEVRVADIAAGHIEAYRADLLSKDHMQLLEMVVRRFQQEPERYPIWLQYMVVHFSGMRYASAHGSWADPKDLLINLRTATLEADFKKLDQDGIDGLCTDKLDCYGVDSDGAEPGPVRQKPALAQTQDPRWRAKIDHHLQGLSSASPYYRRRALFDLLLDEQNYEVETMGEDQAQQELVSLKDSLPLPDWMWQEIVRETQLRIQEVKDPGWETLTPEEQEDKDSPKWAQYRQIMADWEAKNLTEWRPAHAETDDLIVTRSVCNEVAEQIQHVRGNLPPGGLTAKPDWYLSLEAGPKGASKQAGGAYFSKASLATLKEGASILWLRFVNDYPNQWRIAKPLTLKNGDQLLPAELFSGRDGGLRGEWQYQYEAGTVKRTGTVTDANNQRFTQVQWLRWIHEATVVEVAETAEGTVVLTFEPALPYEDKRLSTIGVFKQSPSYVTYSISPTNINGAFVGYTPSGDVPYENLQHMLDWNHILLRDDFMSQADLQNYWSKFRQKPQP